MSKAAPPRDPIGPGKRHARHRGSFDGERTQIFWLQIVHVALAAGPRDDLGFERHHGEEIGKLAPGGAVSEKFIELPDGSVGNGIDRPQSK